MGTFGGQANKATGRIELSDLWHKRLGYPRVEFYLIYLVFFYVGKSAETGEGCEICYRAKQTWDSFLKVIIKRMVFLI